MFRKNLQIIMLLIITFGVLQLSYADEKIKLRLHQPPPNKLGVGDMWNLELTNTTDKEIKIFLTGTATEEKDGLIVEGKSKVFTIKPGKKTYGYEDFKDGEVNWKNKSSQESILRTGNVKEGNYTICVTAFYENGDVADQESCIEQTIKQSGSITLISPVDGAELDPDTLPGLMFSWTPLPNGGPYSLRIVELKGDQSPEVAFKQNRAIYEKDNIKSTTYSMSDPVGGSWKYGIKYAWQVSSDDVQSEVYSFSMSSATHVSSYLDSVYCTSTPGQYRFKLRVCVDYNNSTFSSATIEPFTFTNNCVPTGVTYAITGLSPILPQTITTPGSGSNCVTFTGFITTTPPSVVTTIEMVSTLRWGSSSYQVTYQPTGVFSALNNCCLPITQLPTMVGWWTFDETSGTTFFDRAGFNNVGTRVGPAGFTTGKVAGAQHFTNGYVSVQDHVDMNVFQCDSLSIDAWIKTSDNGTMPIVEKRELTPCGQPLGYAFFIQNGKLGFQVGNGLSFSNYISPAVTPVLNNGVWQHVAVTMKRNPANTVITLYRDGVIIHTVTITPPVGSLNNSSPLLIGCITSGFAGGGTTFNGDIDEVEIFKRVLTQPQINSIFSAQSFGKCKQ